MNKIRAEINKIEMRGYKRDVQHSQQSSCCFEKIEQRNKPLALLLKREKKEDTNKQYCE